jgi:xanthine/uracil permease
MVMGNGLAAGTLTAVILNIAFHHVGKPDLGKSDLAKRAPAVPASPAQTAAE